MLRKIVVTALHLPILLCVCCAGARGQDAAKSSADDQSYTLKMPVDEVKVTFHVSDGKGDPLEHVKKDQIQLFDNGKQQNRTVAFHEYRDLPIRVGFLLEQ